MNSKDTAPAAAQDVQVRDLWILLIAVSGWGLFAIGWMEKVPINHGFGWDGHAYGLFAQNFWEYVKGPGLGIRHDRFLPSLVVYTALDIANISKSAPHVIAAFELLNIVSLYVTAFFWWASFRHLHLRSNTFWIGTIGLFTSSMIMKFGFWYPVRTDLVGLALATAVLYGTLTDKWSINLVAAGLSMFVWPTVAHVTLLLAMWPCKPMPRVDLPLTPMRRALTICILGFWLIALGIAATNSLDWDSEMGYADQTLTWRAVWPISVVTLTVFSTLAIAPVVRYFAALSWPDLIENFEVARVMTLLGLIVAGSLFSRSLSVQPSLGFFKLIFSGHWSIFFRGTVAPLIAVVAHVSYLGPIVLLGILRYRGVGQAASRLGPSVMAVIAAMIFLGTSSETRHLMAFMPIFALLVAMSFEKSRVTLTQILALALYGVWWSKVWLPINLYPQPAGRPLEHKFVSHGPWMTIETYLFQAVWVLVTLLLLFWLFLDRRAKTAEKTDQSGRRAGANPVIAWSVHLPMLALLIGLAAWLHIKHAPEMRAVANESNLYRMLPVGAGEHQFLIYPAGLPLIGDLDDPFLFVLLFDYSQPESRQMYATLQDARSRYGNQIGFVCLPVPSERNRPADLSSVAESVQPGSIPRIAAALWCADPAALDAFNSAWVAADGTWNSQDARQFAEQVVGRDQLARWLASDKPEDVIRLAVRVYRSCDELDLPLPSAKDRRLPSLIMLNKLVQGAPHNPDEFFAMLESNLQISPVPPFKPLAPVRVPSAPQESLNPLPAEF